MKYTQFSSHLTCVRPRFGLVALCLLPLLSTSPLLAEEKKPEPTATPALKKDDIETYFKERLGKKDAKDLVITVTPLVKGRFQVTFTRPFFKEQEIARAALIERIESVRDELKEEVMPPRFEFPLYEAMPTPTPTPFLVREIIPLNFLSTGDSNDSIDRRILALNAMWNRKPEAPLVRRDANNIYLCGEMSQVVEAKSQLYLLDAPRPQVQLDVWTIQASGDKKKIAQKMANVRRSVRAAQHNIKEAPLLLLQTLQKCKFDLGEFEQIKPIMDAGFNIVSVEEQAEAVVAVFQSLKDKNGQQIRLKTSLKQIADDISQKSLPNAVSAIIKSAQEYSNLSSPDMARLVNDKIASNVKQKGLKISGTSLFEMLALFMAVENREAKVKDFAIAVANSWLDERNDIDETIMTLSGRYVPSVAKWGTVQPDLQEIDAEMESLKARRLRLDSYLFRYVQSRNAARVVSVSPLLFANLRALLSDNTKASDLAAIANLGTALLAHQKLEGALLISETKSLYEHRHAPKGLARHSAAIDAKIKALIEAFNADLQEIYLQPLLNDIRRESGGKDGIALIGKSRLVVTSGGQTSLEPKMDFMVEASIPAPFDASLLDTAFPGRGTPGTPSDNTTTTETIVKDKDGNVVFNKDGTPLIISTRVIAPSAASVGTQVLGSVATFAKLSSPEALALAALLSPEPKPVYSTVAPGVKIKVRPSVMPDGSSARLEIESSFGVKTTLPENAASRDDIRLAKRPATIESHQVETDLNISALDLFELSSFNMETITSRTKSFAKIGQVPLLGKLFEYTDNHTIHQESTILVQATILPRVASLMRFYTSGKSDESNNAPAAPNTAPVALNTSLR